VKNPPRQVPLDELGPLRRGRAVWGKRLFGGALGLVFTGFVVSGLLYFSFMYRRWAVAEMSRKPPPPPPAAPGEPLRPVRVNFMGQ